jgi:Holliday junction resolvasome RuvABC ATP-dependent DNA helicase subunit
VADEIDKDDLETLVKTANNENQPILLHIDEIDALPRSVQHLLLTKLDVRQTVYCIGTAASVKGKPIKAPRPRRTRARKQEKPRDPLLEAFRLRFTIHHHTQRPDNPEMVEWLKARCLAWKIEADSEGTFEYLVERTGCRPGLALKVLATSTLFGRRLTRPIVDYHNFDANE